jgi:phosphatidate cytidylyltransferase
VKERVLTAIVLLAVVVGSLFLDPTGWAVKVLIVLIAGIGGFELGKLLKMPTLWGCIAGLVTATAISGKHLSISCYALFAIVPIPLLILGVRRNWLYLIGGSGFLYGMSGFVSLYLLSSAKSPANWPLLMTAAIPIWCGDTVAIFVGKAFGKHKMTPSISPNKTWEGGIGNLLACVAAAVALGVVFHYPMLLMVLLGLNCGILGQAGDLFESWLKRQADVKDSGNILPGHGGLLDRLDSLMATAPFSLLILQSLIVPGKP